MSKLDTPFKLIFRDLTPKVRPNGNLRYLIFRPVIVDLIFSFAVKGAGIPLAFAANVLAARLLGPSQYGTYMTLLSLGLIGSGIAVWGFGPVMTREVSSVADAEWPHVMTNEVAWALKRVAWLSLVTICVLFILIWSEFTVPDNTWAERFWTILIIPFSAFLMLEAGVLSGMREVARSQAIGGALKNVMLFVGILLLYMLSIARASCLLMIQVLSFASVIWIGWVWIQRKVPIIRLWQIVRPPPTLELKRQRALWRNASHFFAISLGWTTLGKLDVVIVTAISSVTEAGYFSAAARLGQFGGMAGLVWVAWLQPRISSCLRDGAYRELRDTLIFGLLGAMSMSAILVSIGWFFAPQIMELLGDGFQPSIWPFRWLLLGYLPWAASTPFYAFLSMSGRERRLSWTLWGQVTVTVLISFPLVNAFGALGAAWAWAGGLAASSLFIIFLGIVALTGAKT